MMNMVRLPRPHMIRLEDSCTKLLRFLLFTSLTKYQVLMLHKWNLQTNKIENLNACKGHKRSVDCIAVNDSGYAIVTFTVQQ